MPPVFPNPFIAAGNSGCCRADSGASTLVYEPCDSLLAAAMPANETEAAATLGAKGLQGKHILVVGDSQNQQWASALILDLQQRRKLGESFPGTPTAATQLRTYWKPWVREVAKEAVICKGVPLFQFNARKVSSTAPLVSYLPLWRMAHHPLYGRCMVANYSRLTQAELLGLPPPVHVLANVLKKLRPHIVVASYGIHWNLNGQSQAVAEGQYFEDVSTMLRTLTEYGVKAASRQDAEGKPPLLLMVDVPPQHYASPTRDGGFDAPGANHSAPCRRISWSSHATLRAAPFGPAIYNRLGHAAVRAAMPTSVRWLESSFEAFVQRPDAHVIEGHVLKDGRKDCSHNCYSPLLWDAVLSPFYHAAANHFMGHSFRSSIY